MNFFWGGCFVARGYVDHRLISQIDCNSSVLGILDKGMQDWLMWGFASSRLGFEDVSIKFFLGGGLFVAGGYVDWDWFHRLIVILLFWASNTETSKKAALEAAAAVSDLLVESINGGVQEVFVNEKQIEMEARSMSVTVQRFSKQTSQWLNVIHTFDSALKVSSTQFLLLPFVFLFLLSLSLFLSPLVCVLSAAK